MTSDTPPATDRRARTTAVGNRVFLPAQVLEMAVIAIAALVALLLIAVLVLFSRSRRLRNSIAAVMVARSEQVPGTGGRPLGEVETLREGMSDLDRSLDEVRELLRTSVSKVGVVRYDAFDDMGGALSFSAAFLDERGNGVVLSAINGRTEGRTYAKPIQAGMSEFDLSPEESAAITAAMNGTASAVVDVDGPRRRRRRAVS